MNFQTKVVILFQNFYLKMTPDYDWDDKENLYFYYCYDSFLPSGIITRFIVRMHQEIEKKENGLPFCWREGVVLNLQNSRALIKMKPDERQIEIKIKGNNKRGALGAICNELDQINDSIKRISVLQKFLVTVQIIVLKDILMKRCYKLKLKKLKIFNVLRASNSYRFLHYWLVITK